VFRASDFLKIGKAAETYNLVKTWRYAGQLRWISLIDLHCKLPSESFVDNFKIQFICQTYDLLTGTKQQLFIVDDARMGAILNLQLSRGNVATHFR